MLQILTRLATRVAWIPLGYIGLRVIVAALEEWARKAEMSADRGGLLAGQDPDAALRALMKLAGGSRLHEMNIEAFLDQAREYDTAGDVPRRPPQGAEPRWAPPTRSPSPGSPSSTRWRRSGEYDQILTGDYLAAPGDHNASVSEEVRAAAASYRESWSQSQDPFIGVLRDVAEGAVNAGERIFNRFSRREN